MWDKLTKSRILRSGARFRGAPRGRPRMGYENFPRHAGRAGIEQDKTIRDRDEDPSFGPANAHPIVIPMFVYVLREREREREREAQIV